MNKENFKQEVSHLLKCHIAVDKFMDNAYNLSIDLMNTDLFEKCCEFQKLYMEKLFHGSKDAIEMFEWYIYEYLPRLKKDGKTPCKENAQAWDKDKNPIAYDLDSLVDYLWESVLEFVNEPKSDNIPNSSVIDKVKEVEEIQRELLKTKHYLGKEVAPVGSGYYIKETDINDYLEIQAKIKSLF